MSGFYNPLYSTTSHTQNTDTYLTTQRNNTIYVDNSRTDSYIEDGSDTKPYKSLQDAHNSIGGTNYLTENQNSVETDLTGFTSKLSATLSRDISEYRFGIASLKIVTPGSVTEEGVVLTGVTIAPSTSYTAEVWVKGSGTIKLALQEQTSGGTVVGTTTKSITLTSIWTRYEIARTFGTTGVSAIVLLYTATTQGITFYADGFRIGLTSKIPSVTNLYTISVALGIKYIGTLDLWRDYISIIGSGASKGAGFTGTINNYSPHLTLSGIHLVGTSSANRNCYFTQAMNGDYLLEIKDCRLSYCTMNITSSGTLAQKNNSYLQVTGGNSLWLQNTINCTGLKGNIALCGGGIYAVNTITSTDSYLIFGPAIVDSNTVNIETGTIAEFQALNAGRNTVNLKTGATLYADITSLSNLSNTFNNTGGTLIRVSDTQILTAVSLVSSTIVYVDKNRTDEYEENGSMVYPYKTISDAITAASSGDTVNIYPGTYTENITLKPGVNLNGQSKFSTYVVGTVTFDSAGTVCCEHIIFKTSGDGNTLNFTGTGVQNLQCNLCNFEHTTGNGHCIYWTNISSSSRISMSDGNITQSVSSGGGTAFTSASTAAGNVILQMVTVQILDSVDNICVNLGGAITWTHTQDAINGKFVTANTARFNITLTAMTTGTVPVIVHNSTNLDPSLLTSAVITTTSATYAVDGIGAFVFMALVYGSTGVGGNPTLNGNFGAIPLTMAPIRIRNSALLPSASVAAGYLTGTFEFDGSTGLYFTMGTTRYKVDMTAV